jgi:hypothetical protein
VELGRDSERGVSSPCSTTPSEQSTSRVMATHTLGILSHLPMIYPYGLALPRISPPAPAGNRVPPVSSHAASSLPEPAPIIEAHLPMLRVYAHDSISRASLFSRGHAVGTQVARCPSTVTSIRGQPLNHDRHLCSCCSTIWGSWSGCGVGPSQPRGTSVCVVLHVAVFTGTSATRPVSPHTSSPRFTTLTHCSNIISH